MAIKKSELYSSLWDACNDLRGSMDASQYKDYVLALLFIKYVSDKWAGKSFSPIEIPEGASFKDMLEFRGKSDIGDLINKRITAPLLEHNRITSMPDFNNTDKLGSGKEMVDRLTSLVNVFNRKELDFSGNRAEGDDILGDAYEYLMRHFATESGKSKGQFYTPAEVSRTMAKVIGINKIHTRSETTVYDPTCGSGSLLLKVGAEADADVSLYGQEKDLATSGLAQMNMILHDNATAVIHKGNTLANPFFKESGNLKQFDYVVANPPFSDKRWSTGLSLPQDTPYNRFSDYGVPPAKNGDYAFMLHIIRSLKRNGKAAVILPHGVLFRGNIEAVIRENVIKKGYIKGIIGLPANLFYGTGIPATIIVLDKENAQNRKGIFMIDAGKGFIKDGNKNRLREQDIKKITDVFNDFIEVDGFSRMVSVVEIEQNEYNLNIPRYIDSTDTVDIQDIEAHLRGDIPTVDVDDLGEYWKVYPTLKNSLFDASERNKYSTLKIDKDVIKNTIFTHSEFVKFQKEMDNIFDIWKNQSITELKAIDTGSKPKDIIAELAHRLLASYDDRNLIDKYDIYQYLMTYWNETMQDDCYIIVFDGWVAKTHRVIEVKKKKEVDKGWDCDLVPKDLVISRYFKDEQNALNALEEEKETIETQLTEMEEEHSGEDGCFSDLDKVNKGNINARLKELKTEEDADQDIEIFSSYLSLMDNLAKAKKSIKTATAELDALLYAKYPTLTPNEVKTLVVDDKWMATIENDISNEIDQISQKLSNRIKDLAERYENTLPELDAKVEALEQKVDDHLKKMGFTF
ncbi:MAG: type I restriction-modification system subunit M [Candidatus Marinimicrobia bacterium]|nr:type I restriction-modification system subunit M [Candidatus Neomarinimicrobiota bacterium]